MHPLPAQTPSLCSDQTVPARQKELPLRAHGLRLGRAAGASPSGGAQQSSLQKANKWRVHTARCIGTPRPPPPQPPRSRRTPGADA